MKILIAEDDLDLAEALTVFFEKNKFSADAVNDGSVGQIYVCHPVSVGGHII